MRVSNHPVSPADCDFEALRRDEFARLDEQRATYLDYTGAALFPESLVRAHLEQLSRCVLGNPHSDNPTAQASTRLMEQARHSVLRYFDAAPAQYEVIFTANATAAIKLTAEAFPFCPSSKLLLTRDNHNSVNGIREFAAHAGAQVAYWDLADSLELSGSTDHLSRLGRSPGPNLFAFPAQSNFSGIQHDLALIEKAQRAGFEVLLDAAAFVPTNRLSLRQLNPEYVCISFYKMFGYPTGIGALLVRQDALRRLRRPWFAGGTVDFVSTQHGMVQLSQGAAAFEDGTANFGSMAAVTKGLTFLEQLDPEQVTARLSELMRKLVAQMSGLQHANGVPLVRWYGSADARYGNTRAFNLQQPDERIIDYEQVERDASYAGISIRGGCFCNPGCAEAAFQLPAAPARHCLQALSDHHFTPARLRSCLNGVAVGALRVSVGIPTTLEDINRFVRFVGGYAESRSKEGKLQHKDTGDHVDRQRAFACSPTEQLDGSIGNKTQTDAFGD